MINLRKVWPAFVLLILPATLTAQQPALTLDAVLTHVRANTADFQTSIPNLAADESIDSQRILGGKVKEETRIQSSFRITRTAADAEPHEKRIYNAITVDGKPAKIGQKVRPPYTFDGGFANVLGFLQSKCIEYQLGDSEPAEAGRIVIYLKSKPRSPDNPACSVNSSQGKAVIDPVSFQVLRLEHRQEDEDWGKIPHFPFVAWISNHNVNTFAVEYAPVTLGEKVFWLPSRVVSTVTDKSKPLSLRYQADYSNYHRFTATVSISAPNPASSPE